MKRFTEVTIHAKIKVAHHNNRCLQSICEVKGIGCHGKTFMGILGEEQNIAGIAMRSVCRCQQIGLLSTCGHTGTRPAALDINQHEGDLGEVGKPQEFGHQREPRSGSGRKGTGTAPACTNGNADGSQFIFGLDNSNVFFATLRIYPILICKTLKCFNN